MEWVLNDGWRWNTMEWKIKETTIYTGEKSQWKAATHIWGDSNVGLCVYSAWCTFCWFHSNLDFIQSWMSFNSPLLFYADCVHMDLHSSYMDTNRQALNLVVDSRLFNHFYTSLCSSNVAFSFVRNFFSCLSLVIISSGWKNAIQALN